jgi:hypothetical protein
MEQSDQPSKPLWLASGFVLSVSSFLWWVYSLVGFGFWFSGDGDTGTGGLGALVACLAGWAWLIFGWWMHLKGRAMLSLGIGVLPFPVTTYVFTHPWEYIGSGV